jgi:hypothetical protein
LKRVCYAALLVSSAAVAAGFEVTPARTEAAGYAVTHGLVVANLVRNCRRFQERIGEDLDAALAQWRERNAERAAAAESYLVYARAAIERQHGELAAHDFDAQTRSVFRHKANVALNDIFERMTPQFGICARWMSAIGEGRADLDWESKYLNTLDELVAFERRLRGVGTR